MTDPLDRLRKALAGRYTIERELGSGGMATVYLAEDVKHHRRVAIKVLRPELAAGMGVERFVREIEIAANLTHPHILPLHDSGKADGFLYYVMPYIEGESLRDRLRRDKTLSVPQAIHFTDQIASALSHAHARGLVHRDIKPENILLAEDQAIVADFGIARAVEVAGGERLTATGLAIGTPAYMSPEQAMGQRDVDARSDVYALGCVVYEMVAGHAPFEGATPQALLARHAAGTVPSLRRSDPSIPLFLERAVEQALAKSPDERFQSADAFADALTSRLVVARVGKRWWHRWARYAAIVAAVLVAAAWGLSTLLGGPAYRRLAVLPPTNLMNDPEQAYFVQGVHNALISELQKAGIVVIARTSVLQYENARKPIRDIAQELEVDALIEASVLRAGDSVEIEVKVVDGRTQQYVADPIVRRSDLRNMVTMYRRLTGAIASEIRATLSPEAEAYLASARSVDPKAYEAYLKGQFHFAMLSPADLDSALEYYELAVEYDPDYALAHAGIALVWAGRSQTGVARPRDALPLMQAAVGRAVELDSTLAEVQFALATVRTWHEWDWAGAGVAFERAIALNPNYPDARAFYSHYLYTMGRPDDAAEQIERALTLDPFNPLFQALCAAGLLFEHRYDDAIARAQNALRAAPGHPVARSALRSAYHAKGMFEEELAVVRAAGAPAWINALDRGFAQDGYRGAMLRAAELLVAVSGRTFVRSIAIAMAYAAGGEDNQALDWLDRAFEEHDPTMPYLNAMTELDGIRDAPRFQDLMRRMGLPS